ncbi:MAG: lysozyme [Brevinema sp.]
MHISKRGLDLIKKWESFVPYSYKCPANINTIGYGHVILKNETFPNTISKEFAEELLIKDCKIFEQEILRHHLILNQHQFDALVSFVFNIGGEAFAKSTLLKHLKENKYLEASKEFARWNKTTINGKKVTLKGLTDRRLDEMRLFVNL